MCSGDCFLAILAIFFPPIAVWIKSGICSADSIINILLCILGYLPGLLHAWYIISLYPEAEYEYHHLPDAEGQHAAGQGPRPGRVTYYYVDHQPSTDELRPPPHQGGAAPPTAAGAAGAGSGGYGTLDQGQQQQQQPYTDGMRYPAPGQGEGSAAAEHGVPPTYEQAIQGDNKVQK